MDFVSDPPISTKIRKMKERVRWQEPPILARGIDQTRMVLEDNREESPDFSFLVIGDSGSGPHRGQNPQRQIAEQMLAHRDSCRFVLHTGDVIYLVGSSEFYRKNFIEPYREFLVGGEKPGQIAYDRMVFNSPILPVPGNHDYYDLPFFYGLMMQTTLPVRQLLRVQLDLDVGWHGSRQGKAYARAFLDYLKAFDSDEELGRHLDNHYTAKTDSGRCLRYQPGSFTRLPNRYYTFRYGGIDFFALDSNTFNAPPPLPETRAGDDRRTQLQLRLAELEQQKLQILEAAEKFDSESPEQADERNDLGARLEQLEEIKLDIEKQLTSDATTTVDREQLDWLRRRLIESWNTADVRGRVVYLHHPPYVTEATKWNQAQTLTIRRHLRQVFDAVAETVGQGLAGRPLVDLVLTGHAHCLEHLRTGNTGHADANINWVICGGSGFSLRRQRLEGPHLEEPGDELQHPVAQSLLYVGRSGQGALKRRPYSFLRIDVRDGRPPRFTVRPFVAEHFKRHWSHSEIEPFEI
ncbi:MAG: metallophosphoesterase [Gemmatimonadaceae bacterium]|nr:metallophosphoesterase [Gloeobacterales cyanobacterium ES-bin-141]